MPAWSGRRLRVAHGFLPYVSLGDNPALSGAFVCFQRPARQFSAASARGQGLPRLARWGRWGIEQAATVIRAVIRDFVKPRQAARQVLLSPVKFRQVLSRLVKALLDGACCNFNDLPHKPLTAAPQREFGRPAPVEPVSGDEQT